MAEYYRNPYKGSGPERGSRTSLWLIIADTAMWILSMAAVFALFIIFVGRFVSPERMWYFSLLGLVAPVIYMAVVLAMLYWIIRWKWAGAAITGAFVLLGLFHVPLYYKLDLTKQYGEPKYDRSCIKVLTFNVHNFVGDKSEKTLDSVARFVQGVNADIVCFQEYSLDPTFNKRYNEKFRQYNVGSSKLENPSCTMELFSKYPIVSALRTSDMGGTGICISTDLVINEDTVRVYNIHLQTTSITSKDKEYISQGEFISDSTRDARFTHIAQALRRNNEKRARQAEIIHDEIAASPYPVILCGDFNDVPVSYAYRTVAKGLEDAFSRQGHMYAHTFRGFFDALRIDYILSSPSFETVSYEVMEATGDISDHYPVLVRLKQTSKQ